MKPSFDHTVSVLVKAYLNDDLEHGDCEKCAVGNIVHAAGYIRSAGDLMESNSCGMWKFVFCTVNGEQIQSSPMDVGVNYFIGKGMILETGYTVSELASVEYAFESAPKGNSDDEWMFNGLMSVIDVLAEIHNIDLTQKETAKALFVK